MPRTFGVAVMVTIDDPNHASAYQRAFDELVQRLRQELARGRDSGAFLRPGVTVEMLAFYRECPERN